MQRQVSMPKPLPVSRCCFRNPCAPGVMSRCARLERARQCARKHGSGPECAPVGNISCRTKRELWTKHGHIPEKWRGATTLGYRGLDLYGITVHTQTRTQCDAIDRFSAQRA